MDESVFGVQLNGTELGGVVGTIAPFGVLGLTFWALTTIVKGTKGVIKTATQE